MTSLEDVIESVGLAIDATGIAAIVLVRTFRSMALHVELEGRWPWQQNRT